MTIRMNLAMLITRAGCLVLQVLVVLVPNIWHQTGGDKHHRDARETPPEDIIHRRREREQESVTAKQRTIRIQFINTGQNKGDLQA
jgi:hypothetical protein